MTIDRRQFTALAGASGLAALLAPGAALAQTKQFFRIGTGGTAGTYYPIGGLIANAISTATLDASAVATNGSVANVNGIVGGSMESGFSQSDVASWAHSGTGVYQGRPKVEILRAIANLYPESLHVVVKKGLNIRSIADLKGKRISIDEPGSGSIINAKAILAGYGIRDGEYRAENLKPGPSAEKLKDGGLDAFFMTTGWPTAALTELATTTGIELLPIEGEPAKKIMAEFKFFAEDMIPDNAYKDVKGVKTLAVGAQWVTSTRMSADVVYEVTKALWSDKTRAQLDAGHAKGKSIRRETALQGLGIPLHDGAARFYREAGLLG
ncbi:MAG: TAXI family TRAP transporter solute-binding subunit [Phreatobacter sp.]|uniref:TAXI family TRAP transporter solute-binding subunit n=1 Tax=Phreatobacter sp. TaxID=1966341 RepID=UPI002733437D|nr:TAXI family TRAP transporter solute-binding subunit [Phreatobacter sp.]MDP2803544.1 TAXI family TRAP transporter solute-binding subunit [Phreatobacter sp.]